MVNIKMFRAEKVLWGEGLFLRPQHFQLQDVYHEQKEFPRPPCRWFPVHDPQGLHRGHPGGRG